MDKKIEIRCKTGRCNKLFMNYYVITVLEKQARSLERVRAQYLSL